MGRDNNHNPPGGAATVPVRVDDSAGGPVQCLSVDVVSGPDAGKTLPPVAHSWTIGSADMCDVTLDDPTVSRFHCELLIDGERVRIRDTGSLNGTRVDGVQVTDAFVRDGSTLSIGHTALQFRSSSELRPAVKPASEQRSFGLLTGHSVAMRQVFHVLEKVSASAATVLIGGETGTGKTAAARSIHRASPRADGPFVVVDCGAVPANLLESELLGHERGAFTGAESRRIGAFEEASGGTLFLDEIGELPAQLQPKLLGVLEGREVRRIGSSRSIPVDVRVIAATHRDLRREINDNTFRPDLYYRLAVVRVSMPSLRERREDVPFIAHRLLCSLGASDAQVDQFTTGTVLQAMLRGSWPGNVRELKNYLERCLVFDQAPPMEDLLKAAEVDGSLPFADEKRRAIDGFERAYLVDLLRRHDGKVSAAAATAALDRTHIYRLMRKYRIAPDEC